jgi:hypothetical protein
MKQKLQGKLTYANVVSTLCLFVVLGGSAYAAFKVRPNSVGTRQLKSKAVTTGKLANGAVTGAKVAEATLSGANINMAALGTVPAAASAAHASNADTLGSERHTASCPEGTTLIRGICFDSISNAAVNTVTEAADACAAKGGWLPSPLELYSIRGVLNLGTGVGSDNRFTDSYYSNTSGGAYRTIIVDGNGAISESEVDVPSRYICAYPLVR